MPEKEKSGKKEKKEAPPSIDRFPTLKSVLEGGEDVMEEYELERRFLPTRLLTKQELAGLHRRHIAQKFVTVLDEKGEPVTFRLRVTRSSGEEGLLYRIARKEHAGASFGKRERQVQIKPLEGDPRTKEFLTLWHRDDTRTIERDRYYLPYVFPNGIECEIHYERWIGGKDDGFARIEIEFTGDKSDEDEAWYSAHKDEPGILPDWIGEDVTDNPAYRVKNIIKDGLPKREG